MLGILLLFWIGRSFYKFAKDNGLNHILWVIISIASYYTAQFLVGIVIAFIDPSLLDNYGAIMLIGLISGFSGVGIAYLSMKNAAKNKVSSTSDSDILDEDLLD